MWIDVHLSSTSWPFSSNNAVCYQFQGNCKRNPLQSSSSNQEIRCYTVISASFLRQACIITTLQYTASFNQWLSILRCGTIIVISRVATCSRFLTGLSETEFGVVFLYFMIICVSAVAKILERSLCLNTALCVIQNILVFISRLFSLLKFWWCLNLLWNFHWIVVTSNQPWFW